MAHTTSTTKEGWAELSLLFSAEAAATCAKSIVLIGDVGCTANTAQTYDSIDKMGESGLTIQDATVTAEDTTVTDDTCQATYTFTAGATATCKGAAMCNDDNDAIFMLACWEADINLEDPDTIAPTLGLQFRTSA